MKITHKSYSVLVNSSVAGDLIEVKASVAIRDEPESNYLAISAINDLTVENNIQLTPKELEEFEKGVIDQYISYRE